jgi:hypothetical protein
MSELPHHCAKCTSRWNGYSTAHCGACHLTFTGITAFDKHRDGSHTDRVGRFCVAPETVGLVLSGRTYPCWGFPGPDGDVWDGGDDAEPLMGQAGFDAVVDEILERRENV